MYIGRILIVNDERLSTTKAFAIVALPNSDHTRVFIVYLMKSGSDILF